MMHSKLCSHEVYRVGLKMTRDCCNHRRQCRGRALLTPGEDLHFMPSGKRKNSYLIYFPQGW